MSNDATQDDFATQHVGQQAQEDGAAGEGKPKMRLEKSLKRNLFIVLAMIIAAVVTMAVLIGMNRKPSSSEAPSTNIALNTGGVGAAVDTVSQREKERLARTSGEDSQAALDKGKSFIPLALPSEPAVVAPPPTSNAGPGPGYDYRLGANNGSNSGNAGAVSAELKKSIEEQIRRIAELRSAPPVSQTEPYIERGNAAGNQAAANQASSIPTGTSSTLSSPTSTGVVLVRGLQIATAKLVSAIDTAKTSFVSAEISGGALDGAYLIGQASVVGDAGVRVVFRQMRLGNETFAINAAGLDVAASNDAVSADIDRRLFSRYVMPVFFSTAQAYLNAKGNPGQQIVVTGEGTTVATPAATARQAAAVGVAAGVGKLGEAVAQTNAGPNTAFLPVNSSLGILFLEAVVKR